MQLGRRLFFDPIMSSDQSISCASCHNPGLGGADATSFSRGVGGLQGNMNAPTVLNARYNFAQFWNGRARTLAEQALQPIVNPVEMNLSLDELEARLNGSEAYRQAFEAIYGPGTVTRQQVAEVLAEYEAGLVTPNSRFDRYLRNELELTPQERNGYELFRSLGCISCHNGINVGGNSYQKIGIINPWHGAPGVDLFALTGREEDRDHYKVPSLRNIALTAPYFHDGSATSLMQAIEVMADDNLGITLLPDELSNLEAFLRSLTGEMPPIFGPP
jgi:cytochrome c peroxidase